MCKEKKESEVTQSCPTLCDPMDHSPLGSSLREFSRQEYWSGLPFIYVYPHVHVYICVPVDTDHTKAAVTVSLVFVLPLLTAMD